MISPSPGTSGQSKAGVLGGWVSPSFTYEFLTFWLGYLEGLGIIYLWCVVYIRMPYAYIVFIYLIYVFICCYLNIVHY